MDSTLGTAGLLLLLFLWFDLWSLALYLTGTSQGTVDLPSSEPEHQVECGFLLDVVVRKGSAIFELLTGEDETLLIWWDLRFRWRRHTQVAGAH